MKLVKMNIAVVVILQMLCLLPAQDNTKALAGNKIVLRDLLSDIEINSDLQFVYPDDLVNNKTVESFPEGEYSRATVEAFLSRTDIAFKVFNRRTYVLFEKIKDEVSTPVCKEVIAKEEVESRDLPDVVLKPVLLSYMDPEYPHGAVAGKIEGKVKVKFKVDQKGNVVQSYILVPSGYTVLDSASRDYVYKLKYRPARINGKPYDVWVTMVFDYRLNDKVSSK